MSGAVRPRRSVFWLILPSGLIGLLVLAPVAAGTLGLLHDLRPSAQALLLQPGLLQSVWLSVSTGLAATALSFAAVVLVLAGWTGTASLKRLRRFLGPLLSVPHAAAAIGLAFLLAPSGLLFRLISPGITGLRQPPDLLIIQDPSGLALTLGLVAKEVPFLLLMALAALPLTACDAQLKTAQSLGYGRVKGFLCFCLPDLYPRLRLPVLAVLAYAASNVDMAAILGPTLPAPLSVRIASWMTSASTELRQAASAGALLQGGVCLGCAALWLAGERAVALAGHRLAISGRRRPADGPVRLASLGVLWSLFALMLAALAALLLWSLARSWFFPAALPGLWTFSGWHQAFLMDTAPLRNSLVLASLSAALALGLVVWLLEGLSQRSLDLGLTPRDTKALRLLVFVPLILPQVSLLFGMQVWFLLPGFTGQFAGVLLAHLIFVMPYVYLSLSGPWFQLDPGVIRSAHSLGLSRSACLVRIKIPLLLGPLLTGFAIGFAVSIGQYLPSLIIGSGRWPTVTTESVALASGGSRRLAAVYALLQMVLPVILFAVALRVPAFVFRNRRALRP